MHDPLVTIIIPVFNRQELIRYCLNSVSEQIYTNWECIVVDDGSSDETFDILNEYVKLDNRFRIYSRNRNPKGAPTCRNIGLENAKGEYVIYLDSDDLMMPVCISQRVALYKKETSFDFHVFSTLLFFDENMQECFNWNIETKEDDIARFFRMDALWQTSGPIYKRSVLLRFEGFNESLRFWQDFDLHLRLLLAGCSYKKNFHLSPDVYIRAGRKDTISRSTAFTSDRQILQERLDFYFALNEMTKRESVELTTERLRSLNSTIYFFASKFYLKHGSFFLFKENWKRLFNQGNISGSFYFHGIVMVLFMKMSNKISFVRHFVLLYSKLFTNEEIDISILSKNKIETIKYES